MCLILHAQNVQPFQLSSHQNLRQLIPTDKIPADKRKLSERLFGGFLASTLIGLGIHLNI